ncbi:MAG: hypothetical protein C5B50_09245 [Verrucomicrobia bacterium]|nr:MAG: hypothetical protein C5B50_09245 [Verrucomicrobiota bacterium]
MSWERSAELHFGAVGLDNGKSSAGFQPAVSPISNRQIVRLNSACSSQAGSTAIQQIRNLRYVQGQVKNLKRAPKWNSGPSSCALPNSEVSFINMIRGYQAPHPLEPAFPGRLQWGPAFAAGLAAGAILLLVPRGTPWASLSSFSPVIMGRAIPATAGIPLFLAWVIHLAVSVLYGLLISRVVVNLRQPRAIFAGALTGLLLYVLNLLVVSLCLPDLRQNEVPVVFTHLVFGLIAASAYRGLIRRRRY